MKIEQLGILPTILGIGIRKIDIKPDENIPIKGGKKVSDKKIVYEFIIDYGHDNGVFTKKIMSVERKRKITIVVKEK